MIIHLDVRSAPATVTLLEPDAFNGFHVRVTGDDADALSAAADRVGALVDDHVLVDRVALEGLAGDLAQSPAWQQQLEGMLAYATSKGWVTKEGAIRAHIERTDG
jgi:hypothetical protein